MIEIRGLSFRYAGESRDALHNIDMTVEDGDFIGVTGPSGAGKTTLTQALSGLVPHRRAGDFFGSVAVNGVDTVDSSLTALALQVGSVFQDIDSQMVAGQVEDEILFGLENFGVDRAEIPRRIDEALGDVGIAPLRHRAIDSLSGGQKQKVAIAAILALRPKILVLDEPTGELDPGASEQIFRLLRRMNEARGMTVIVVEQKIMLLSAYAKKLAVLLSVTQMSDLSGVLVQRLHVPYKYAFTLTTATRFIPVFANSLSGIMEAQTARGVAFDTKNPFKKLGLILPLCMPLLISSVGRIHDTAAAAEMRGFTLRTRESQSRRYTFKSGDLFAALIAAALVAAGALL